MAGLAAFFAGIRVEFDIKPAGCHGLPTLEPAPRHILKWANVFKHDQGK
jgi:hypothetical protein